MDEESFGALVVRLAKIRQLDLAALANSADVGKSGLSGLLSGETPRPSQSQLRSLAPILGLHAPDLFVIAGCDVPDDLAPLDHRAGRVVPDLVRHAVVLSPDQKNALRGFVASLPHEPRELAVPPIPAHEQYPHGSGAVLMRLARNRNLNWAAVAKTFLAITGRYWSPATYGQIGRGLIPVSGDIVADFCAVLDVPSEDLMASIGLALSDEPATVRANVAGLAELIWDVRYLAYRQIVEVRDFAKSMR